MSFSSDLSQSAMVIELSSGDARETDDELRRKLEENQGEQLSEIHSSWTKTNGFVGAQVSPFMDWRT